VDTAARELRRGGRRVELSPKAFDLLVLLLEARPRAVPQAELRDRLWPGVFVAYTSLARVVTEVRQGLGEDSRSPRYVRTLHGYGYAFESEASLGPPASSPSRVAFALVNGERVQGIALGETVLGRSLDCGFPISSTRVSRRHCRILVSAEGATLEDLGSKHGTFLNGRRLDGPQALADGDHIGVGDAVLSFRAISGQSETE
jgi:hypothetical protein